MAPSKLEYSFINISEPTAAKVTSYAVRSHVAQLQWQKATDVKQIIEPQTQRKRKRTVTETHQSTSFVFELDETIGTTSLEPKEIGTTAALEPKALSTAPSVNGELSPRPSDLPAILRLLGGGRIDPFRSYPVPWRPFLPAVVDHCKRYYLSYNLSLFLLLCF